jgi:mRNA interferase MazF
MNRGEIWWAYVGNKRRPVLIVTRNEVIDVRSLVMVAEISTTSRGLAAEVEVEDTVGLDRPSVVNCDGLHITDENVVLATLAAGDAPDMDPACAAIGYAHGC